MKDTPISRRDFLKNMGIAGAGAFLAASPWLSAFSEVTNTSSEKCRLAIIGPGSRGRFLMSFLVKNPKVDIVALCDIYQPSIDEALKLAPKAKVYGNYKEVLEDKNIDAVLVATPLSAHYKIVMDAFDAGKHVFCEKSIGYTMEECYHIYQKHRSTGKIFFTGQQRLFDPRYIKAMEMIHAGLLGEINSIRAYWFRNNDWRRPVPSPDLERKINWRLYKEYSCGLVTELATHQLQAGNWALRMLPEKVAGMGDIVYWKDGREVYDSINLIYHYPNGVKMTYESMIANKFYGLEEEIMGSKGTMEPEKGKYYFEDVEPAPGIMQLINQIEHKIFDNVSFAGPSWVPETASVNKGHLIMDNVTTISGQSSVGAAGDGSIELVTAFCEAAITGKPAPNLVEEAYYSSVLGLLGLQAIDEGRVITFPDEYKIPYLNFA